MVDIDFRQVVSRCGGQRDAFEDLCCQLAHHTVPEDASYIRLHGAGGDGGVECFADLPDGSRMGWQAKYVFDIDSLLTQAAGSVTTALKIHPTITRYVVCFPFDVTGPTGRCGRSGQEKLDEWRTNQEKKFAAKGRQLIIESWPASKLRELLLQYDVSGGIREFFFNQKILTNEWFSEHLERAQKTAGPRYTPKLNVKTDLWKWFAAFGRVATWSGEFKVKLRAFRQAHDRLASALRRSKTDSMSPSWPEGLREDAQVLVEEMWVLLDRCDRLVTVDDPSTYKLCVSKLNDLLDRLATLELHLVDDLEAQHGKGKADSPGFRQFMAEYMVSFPAAHLDNTREAIAALRDLYDWLLSPACSLAFERVFVLSGVAGSGKSHGVCDAADRRFSENLLTCLTFGHEFRGIPDPWTRLLENLGLPITLGMNGLLDALNAAGEASGSLLIIYIDAINETRPLGYWRDRLSTVIQATQRRPHLRLCITCRTSFIRSCLPEGNSLSIVEHAGFSGIERVACQAFFQYYNLAPPIAPILQPEFANPLYLRLLCETLRSCGLRRMPSGWSGLAPTIRAFLQEKERQFAAEYETSEGANIVSGCLMAIVHAIADLGDSALSRSQAQQVISAARSQANILPVLDWLVRTDLLMEDAPAADAPLDDESVVRPAFERLGDFLIAGELVERTRQTGIAVACKPGGPLYTLLKDSDALEQNSGVLAALSILVPEQNPGLEFPNLVDDESIRSSIVRIAVRSFPSRDPTTFSSASVSLIKEALGLRDFSFNALDAILAISWQPSVIDAFWLDGHLRRKLLAKRDAFWCAYLHDRFESHGVVHRLINAAFELPIDQLELEIAERWAIVLLWFTAAANRRIKDGATRAVTAILTAHPQILPSVLRRLIDSDDDEVRERTLLSCYGALIVSRNNDAIRFVTSIIQEAYRKEPTEFANALIRDHIRCISELARTYNALPEGSDPELTMRPIDSEWPLDLPSDEEIKRWEMLPKLARSCLDDDFFVYSMDCLRPWEDAVPKKDMGKWILQRVAAGFFYEGSGCEQYDGYMLGKYGGGRSREKWADRIGKKYQWVAMYQLASRLHDHVKRKNDKWTPKPLRTPLILLEERKLDPTLSSDMMSREQDSDTWWIGSSADLVSNKQLPGAEWITRQEDLPLFEKLLSVVKRDGQRWRLLVSYPSWGGRDKDADWNNPYRHVWTHVESYLIPKKEIEAAYDCLHRRNFFGRWMPEGADWLYGFAGEYPWATSFNTEPEEWYGRGRDVKDWPASYSPTWNGLAVEWEYDASLPRNLHMIVPARTFFTPRDLWGDGRDGYRLINGRTVFRDPSLTEDGPSSLVIDADDLLERIDKLGLRLIWTLLGEKTILGGPHDKPIPRCTFSQIARLKKDGVVEIGERVFFDDYDQDIGPLLVINRRRSQSSKAKIQGGPKKRTRGRS